MTQLTLGVPDPMPQLDPADPALGPTVSVRRTSVDRIIDTLLRQMTPSEVVWQLIALRPHAVFNALLAIVQLPYATMLRTESRWESEWGRRVRPGQHPIVLLAPFGPVELYFDASQTEPTEPMGRSRSLPISQQSVFTMSDVIDAPRLLNGIIEDAKRYGVRVVTSEVGTPLAGKIQRVRRHGCQDHGAEAVPMRWVVTLAASHSPTEQLSTLVHELGHLFCGHIGSEAKDTWSERLDVDAATKEFEAESVAQLVLGRLAPETALPAYSDQVLGDGSAAGRADWVHVAQAADRVMKPFQNR